MANANLAIGTAGFTIHLVRKVHAMTLNTAHSNWKREQQQFTKISTASMPDGFVPGLSTGLAASSASAIA